MSQQAVVQNDQMVALLSYLASKPTVDEVSQFLVLDVLRELKPRAALISVFDSSGDVSAAGSFGLPSDISRALRHLSLWDKAPSVDVIRDGEPLFFNSRESIVHEYPWLEGYEALLSPTVVWPLALGTQRLGSLQVHFADPVDQDDADPLFSGSAPILGLYISLCSLAAAQSEVESTQTSISAKSAHSESELTSRQLRILHLLADGLTNPQIASRIGFSDSTVRQETMAIYRFLGASGRRDAVHIAGLRGLLSEAPAVTPQPGVMRQVAMSGQSQHPSVWSRTIESSNR